MDINFDSISIDDNGRVSFSGLGSGIDFTGAVDAIMAVRRLPVDRLETRIDTNDEKILAYQELRNLLNTLSDSLDTLRGNPSVGNVNDSFSAKQAFASVSRTDGIAASLANNLIGVTVTNAATLGSHDIEVLQTARAHKISSDAFTSTSSTIGFADGDQFTIEGTVITVSATDTLLSLRDRINTANTGTSPTKVSASIVSVSSTEHYLVLTKDTTGTDISISDTTNTPLQTAGILNSSPAIKNELQASQKSQFYADGLIDKTNKTYESARQSASTNTLGSSGTITFNDGSDYAFNYNASDTLQQFVTNINNDATLQGKNISASLVTEGGQVRVKIVGTGNAFTMTETGGGSVITNLGITNSRILIERDTNTITDLFDGITLSLFQSEVGTNIKIDIEQNLTTVKSQINAFVDAYNAVKVALNTHTSIDETTNQVSADAVLFGERTIADIQNELSQIFVLSAQGLSADFSVLAQIGIDFVNNAALSDPLEADTLEIDVTKLDSVLLSNPDDVRRMFAFDFTSSNPQITLLSFSGKTTYNAAGYTLNIAYDDRYQSSAYTTSGSFTQVDAQTGGPAADGISTIAFSDPVISGQAFRYSYSGSPLEELTLKNITTGATETIDITSLLDAATGVGEDLAAGETVAVNFPTLEVTITLSGDNGFTRATAISDGTLDITGIGPANGGNMTGGTISTPTSDSTFDKDTVDALIAAGAYNAATGLLTLTLASTAADESHFNTASGIKFRIDGGSILADISATDLDDSSSHTIAIYVTDGGGDVLVATLNSYTFSGSTGAGSGNITIDLGTGLTGETSTTVSATSPIQNYLNSPAISTSNQTFQISNSGGVLGTVTYNATDSLLDLSTKITAISGVTASIVTVGSTFRLEVTDNNNDTLTFHTDTDNLLSQLVMTDNGNSILSANIGGAANGADNGTVTVNGNIITVTSSSAAEDLKVLYTGNSDIGGITFNYTVGFGATMFAVLDKILKPTEGTLETTIDVLNDNNEFSQKRIDQMLARLDQQRQSLLDRFIRMELALLNLNRILDSMEQSFAALTSSQRSR